jgi:release factor glutamine methyltransferase
VIAADALGAAVDALTAAGCDTPRLDAELLLAQAMGVSREALVADPRLPLEPPASRAMMETVRRRVSREPLAYILGHKGFRYVDVRVDRRVLIPRPDTELLVEVALELAPANGSVHDVGTGSGCVALAVASERPDLRVTASDASRGAVDVARSNGVNAMVFDGLPPGEYDLVVANLPYVREDEWASLAPEITRWEPREALLAGEDGLDAIRSLLGSCPAGLLVALEHAPAQAAAMRELLDEAETRCDLSGRERVSVGRVR